jgi:hypothetical protein
MATMSATTLSSDTCWMAGPPGPCGPLLPPRPGGGPPCSTGRQSSKQQSEVSVKGSVLGKGLGPAARCCHHGLVGAHPAVQVDNRTSSRVRRVLRTA